MHTISFGSIHRSIITMENTELPPFVVLTGRNGSGKSHLLEALNEGKVKTSLTDDFTNAIRLFDWSSIVPRDTGVFDPAQDHTRRSQWFSQILAHRNQYFPGLQQAAISLGVPAANCSTIGKIRELTIEVLREILPDPSNAASVQSQLRQHLSNIGRNVFSSSLKNIPDEGWRRSAHKLNTRSPDAFFTADQAELFEQDEMLWGEIDPFQQAFGRMFTSYRELIHSNDRLEKYPPPGGVKRHLGSEEFVAVYGPPPWDFVNRILSECLLDFRVDSPPLHQTTAYEPKLTLLSSGAQVRFIDLSSGEKVLMSFALCLYNAEEKRQEKIFPNSYCLMKLTPHFTLQ